MDLNSLFSPKAIAVIGASPEEGKIGNVILTNLKGSYKGKIYPINPKYDHILGMNCYKNISEIEGEIDLAIISLPSKYVISSFKECQDKKVKYVIIVTAGFKEIGGEGEKLEDELKNIIAQGETRVIGPNTVGIYIPRNGISTALTVKERSGMPGNGNIAYISQSGALGLLLLDVFAYQNIGVHSFINLGNRVDLNENTLIDYLADQKEVKSIMMYLESFSDGKEFFEIAKKVTQKVPIVLLKGGITQSGQKAASHHTGAMMRSMEHLEGVLKQCGVIKASDETELVDYALALSNLPLMRGNKIAIITTAGGVGVTCSDIISKSNVLHIANLSEQTKKEIMGIIPPIGSANNPIDMTVEATNEQYQEIIKLLNNTDEVDAMIVFALFQSPKVDENLIAMLDRLKNGKPLIIGNIGGSFSHDMVCKAMSLGIPFYPSITRTVKAAEALYKYSIIRGEANGN